MAEAHFQPDTPSGKLTLHVQKVATKLYDKFKIKRVAPVHCT